MFDFEGKTVLITGGTGSFGHALLDSIIDRGCKEIRIFSRDELKQEIMRNEFGNSSVKFYIGDVRDRYSVDQAMKNVNLIFHAAALKQVPSCEFFPIQAVLTNIMGSNNVIEIGVKHHVERIVCLSTDKAVYPVNSMGMTKALMEKSAQAMARRLDSKDTIISSVRYGNVMCSRGSVIPLFISQIKKKQPLTITDPDMTRFMLSIREAIDLVTFAFEHGNQGDISIKKAPASSVIDLANALKNIFKSDSPIKIIGPRHGEKKFETLATTEELRRSKDMGDYFRVKIDDRDLNYNKYFTEGNVKISPLDDYTSHNTTRLNIDEVEALLRSLPEVVSELNPEI